MSAVYVAPALLDAQSRAGASDQDEAAWHEERVYAATATNVRDMWLLVQSGSTIEAAAEAVARKKLKRRNGSGPEARWGQKVREPVLSAYMQLRYSIRPESRVFHHPENSRWLASPDGVGVNFDEQLVLSEVKTGAERFFGYEHMAEKGYIVQQAWAMFVLGAIENRGIFEQRLGTRASGFEPGEQFEWTVPWGDVESMVLEQLVPMADALLAAIDTLLDAAEVEVDEDVNSLAMDVLHGREIESEGKALKDVAWKALLELCEERGERVDQDAPFAKVLWTPEERGVEKVREVDATHPAVVDARRAVADAQAVLAAVEDKHSTVAERPVVTKAAKLTVSDPQKRRK